jgi:hypothetical protein
LKSRVFLEVERDAPMSNFRIPVDVTSPIAPWMIASKLAQGFAGLGRDVMRMAQSARIFDPNPWMNPTFGAEMLKLLTRAFAPGGKGFTLNSLNLKQFRSCSDPHKISYQALTNGPMQVTSFNGGGPLGEERMALGDMTGGYTVKLYDYSTLPIARTLGLEVQRRARHNNVDVLALEPVMPFWANINVKYLPGTNLAWRTRDGVWRASNGEPLPAAPEAGHDPKISTSGYSQPQQTPYGRKKRAIDDPDWPLFNTTVSSAADNAIAGPFEFKETVVRVLPLLAYRKKLQAFVDEAINEALGDPAAEQGYRFQVWCRPDSKYGYVYLTAATLGTVTSSTNNVGDWAKYAVSFLIPVQRLCKKDGEWEINGVGVVPAGMFVDTSVAAVSRSEILGIPTLRAEFVRPPSVWLEEGQTDLQAKQTLLRVDTEVFTALREGQRAAIQPFIDISSHDFAGIGEPTSLAIPDEWAGVLRAELKSKSKIKCDHKEQFKVAQALAIELLGSSGLTERPENRPSVSFYTLKQFRDIADPQKACYQSLIRAPLVFDEVFDVQEIEETLRIRIHEFPAFPLVEKLGLVGKTVHEKGVGIVYGLQPIRPFYIRANVHELDGERLCWRAGASTWMFDKPAGPASRSRSEGPAIVVDLQTGRALDDGNPCEIQSFIQQSSIRREMDGRAGPRGSVASASAESERNLIQAERRQKGGEESDKDRSAREDRQFRQGLTELDLRLAREAIDPQMVIEAALSREWANHKEHARWRVGRRKLQEKLSGLGGDIPFAHLGRKPRSRDEEEGLKEAKNMVVNVEREFYEDVLDSQNRSRGWRLRRYRVDRMLDAMSRFTPLRLDVAFHRDIVSTWKIMPSKLKHRWVVDDQVREQVKRATELLVTRMRKIATMDIVGEPSNDDLRVSAVRNRLRELLGDEQTKEQELEQEITHGGGPLIDTVLKAAVLACEYCDVQREALFNKLAKAHQKPDFCVRRDSVSCETREKYFPRQDSWDDDWYSGEKECE